MNDPWESADPYEQFMGRWSRRMAARFLDWLEASPGGRWIDVGCGTGALSLSILRSAEPAEILAVDASEAFIATAQHLHQHSGLRFAVADARNLPERDDYFDVAVSGIALNFIPEPLKALAEMKRVTRSGGAIAIYVWDYADRMQMLRYFWDAAVSLDSAAEDLDEGSRFPLCQPAALRALFQEAGLENIVVDGIEIPTQFRDFNDYWLPFLGGQGPAPGYVMSLSSEHRSRLEQRLRETLPVQNDGAISLVARAWTVKALVA
ncbi:MAG: methyltransferase domain-containing protein [Caldilineales bacterium]|nr:methyltransferase domain-containing protein [Caldilineales bacterium]